MAIDARIKIEAGPGIEDDEERAAEQHVELLQKAAEVAGRVGRQIIRLEVEYPLERLVEGASWDRSGDAIEIDLRDSPPTIRTLMPYSEMAP